MELAANKTLQIDWNTIESSFPYSYKRYSENSSGHPMNRLEPVADFFEQQGFNIHIDYQYLVRTRFVLWHISFNRGLEETSTYGKNCEFSNRKVAYFHAIMKCFELMEFSLTTFEVL